MTPEEKKAIFDKLKELEKNTENLEILCNSILQAYAEKVKWQSEKDKTDISAEESNNLENKTHA